ncbi:tRNA (adenosine(37)-N6)-threonylcarbamoyltransferase complex dimerization subunit type 1 TsaB [Mesorhizobium sp. LHD-90]|uniref:tRNA (adenosine(37)-N6)-threonylcarbamoyltransferase complex dimerization subunit type 1 TsaB n=1 Tax=Mesorhizobium sp. LHD-90 TaxID=3071414 RepID=UPI0027E00EED|nr:tRNA (adenosine(37)-N6)-threonylcarbamoyltransferase complex dimerization subunit type 1 TsaB [Mesorhizobium sp. LHD-90]MDQ6435543.1 tRNA (adenosine(37)-N6)-threonylcarbamoyltransferase complex dimerization subunit type 1 TsaB [Mesorhizobium sp. LHD-90]
MILLAIDCSASLCAACVFDAREGRELGRSVLDLGKGHAERLIAVIDAALAQAGKTYADLQAIAVSIGPGSFTGIRVAVSAARGLALALNVPAIGVGTLEAIAAEARGALSARKVMSVLGNAADAEASVQTAVYDEFGHELYAPSIMRAGEAANLARDSGAVLAGGGAEAVAAVSAFPLMVASTSATADIAVYARLAAAKGPAGTKPSPLYLREPDAKPQAGFILPRRSG